MRALNIMKVFTWKIIFSRLQQKIKILNKRLLRLYIKNQALKTQKTKASDIQGENGSRAIDRARTLSFSRGHSRLTQKRRGSTGGITNESFLNGNFLVARDATMLHTARRRSNENEIDEEREKMLTGSKYESKRRGSLLKLPSERKKSRKYSGSDLEVDIPRVLSANTNATASTQMSQKDIEEMLREMEREREVHREESEAMRKELEAKARIAEELEQRIERLQQNPSALRDLVDVPGSRKENDVKASTVGTERSGMSLPQLLVPEDKDKEESPLDDRKSEVSTPAGATSRGIPRLNIPLSSNSAFDSKQTRYELAVDFDPAVTESLNRLSESLRKILPEGISIIRDRMMWKLSPTPKPILEPTAKVSNSKDMTQITSGISLPIVVHDSIRDRLTGTKRLKDLVCALAKSCSGLSHNHFRYISLLDPNTQEELIRIPISATRESTEDTVATYLLKSVDFNWFLGIGASMLSITVIVWFVSMKLRKSRSTI